MILSSGAAESSGTGPLGRALGLDCGGCRRPKAVVGGEGGGWDGGDAPVYTVFLLKALLGGEGGRGGPGARRDSVRGKRQDGVISMVREL